MKVTERKVYLNGKMVPEKEAKISVFDIGFMYGATIYESIRTFKHKPFKLDEHLRRFEGSLQYVGLESLITKEEMVIGMKYHSDKGICIVGGNKRFLELMRIVKVNYFKG